MADITDRLRAIEEAKSENFLDLVDIARLNPATSFQHTNLRSMDFRGCDLRGFNFAGSALHGSDFSGARIAGAFFDCAQLNMPELRTAADYADLIEQSRDRLQKDEDRKTKAFLETLFEEAVRRASPEVTIPLHLPPEPTGKTVLVSIGKAASTAARVVGNHWSGPLEGIVLSPYGMSEDSPFFEAMEAGFPIPDQNNYPAAEQIFDLVSNLSKDDLVILVLSSGATALTAVPIGDITLEELTGLQIRLLSAGASLEDMQLVRSYLTVYGCGRLAKDACPAQITALVIQDGLANSVGLVGGSPTSAVNITSDEVAEILRRHHIQTPVSVEAVLNNPDLTPPSPGDPCFERAAEKVVTSWDSMLEIFAAPGVLDGTEIVNLGALEGNTQDMALEFANRCRTLVEERRSHPLMLVSGGEATVDLSSGGIGEGGRNTEFLLSLAIALDGLAGVSAIAISTDGRDGSADAAGAFISPRTLARARASNIDPQTYLQQHNSYHFFKQLDDLIMTGPTGTNLSDLRAILIEPNA